MASIYDHSDKCFDEGSLPSMIETNPPASVAIAPTKDVVHLEDVSVWYNKFQALDRISLRLPTGATGLVGRNGAGKSTLLRLLLGLIRASTGTGEVLGVPLERAGSVLRHAVGYMPENDAFLPGMKAIEQVTLAGELCSLSHREAIRRSHEVLSYTGLGEARYRNVEGFSTGMKQRLKLAIALVHDPDLLLLDEPTVGLDPPGRQRMLDLIADLVRSHGKSLVISTHLLADIQYTCDYVVMIERGRIMTAGTLDEVVGSEASRFRIQWEGEGDSFIERLRAEGIEVTPKTAGLDGTRINKDGEAIIKLPEFADTRTVFQAAFESGVRLRMIDPELEELGELYHRLLDREAQHVR